MKHQYLNPSLLTSTITLALSGAAQAVVPFTSAAPDAGQTLQQLQQVAPSLPKTDTLTITTPSGTIETLPGGPQVELKQITIVGNTLFNHEHLLGVLGKDVIGQIYDLAGLRNLAGRISNYYREQGYPFARAFLPAQNMGQGNLVIEILEGKYGDIITTGDNSEDNAQAQSFLSSLNPGDVIESSQLERATLILSDQPGIKSGPVVSPGKTTGTGDLIVNTKRDKLISGSLGADNHGNRYTGQNKVRANININSPFMFGDQVSINALVGDHQEKTGMWYGGFGYSLPLNGDGLRANFSFNKTAYQIGKNLKDSSLKGTADVYAAGLSYPIIRSQKTNLNLSGVFQHKLLNDEPGSNHKTSSSLPISLSFDKRDTLGGGGITFGALTWTKGSLYLDDTLKSNDSNKTKGDFDKLSIDLARLQALPEKFSLYVRGTAQWSNKNLDSSEGIGIGGVSGVRAYPVGEGYGNVGWVTQTELRYAFNANYNPYLFYDMGSTTANQTTVDANPIREISGAGVGLRYTQDEWNADISAAWRLNGGKPNDTTTPDETPRVWASVSYQL